MAAVTVAVAGTGDSSNVATYATASFTPTAGDLLVVMAVVSGSTIAGGAAGTCTGSTNGLTSSSNWTRVDAFLNQASTGQCYLFLANKPIPASPASMTCTVNVTGANGTGAVVSVAQVAGMSKFGADAIRLVAGAQQLAHREAQTSGTTLAGTMPAAAVTGNVVIGWMCNNQATGGVTEPTSFAERGDAGYTLPTQGIEWATRDSGHTSATVTWGTNSAGAWSNIVFELDADQYPAPAVRTTREAVARRAFSW